MATSHVRPIALLFAGLVAIGLTGFAGRAAWRRVQAWRDAARIEREAAAVETAYRSMDPYELMRAVHAAGGGQFLQRLASTAEQDQQAAIPPGSMVDIDGAAAELDDLGVAMRSNVPYHVRGLQREFGLAEMLGQVRMYTHRRGAVVVNVGCVRGRSECDELPSRYDQVETQILAALDDRGLDSLRPPDATCQLEPTPGTPGRHHAACRFADGIIVVLTRLSVDDAKLNVRRTGPQRQFEAWLATHLEQTGRPRPAAPPP